MEGRMEGRGRFEQHAVHRGGAQRAEVRGGVRQRHTHARHLLGLFGLLGRRCSSGWPTTLAAIALATVALAAIALAAVALAATLVRAAHLDVEAVRLLINGNRW